MAVNHDRSGSAKYVMPEQFSFGIEESDQPRRHAEPSGKCDHRWRERETEHQTLREEGKVVWHCDRCGRITSTYTWQKP